MKTDVNDRLTERISLSISIPAEFDNVAGDVWKSRFVLVGEAPASISSREKYFPFCSLSGCSGWLNNLLDEENIPEGNLFWINAQHIDGTPNNKKIFDYLLGKKIICLGKKAEKWVEPTGLKYETVPHPQYWKRFKSKERYPLMDLLK